MGRRVFVRIPFNEEQLGRLKALADGYGDEMIFRHVRELPAEELAGYDAVIGNLNPECLKGGTKLSWVQLNTAGADEYAEPGILRDEAVLTCSTGAYGTAISEYMVCMLLMMMKRIPAFLQNQKDGIWKDEGNVESPIGKRVLVVGTGNIGTEFARRVRSLGTSGDPGASGRKTVISGIRRRSGICPEGFDEIHSMEELRTEVSKADIIALCLPAGSATFHLFDRDTLLACKEGSYLLNVGRGNVIDNSALLDPSVTSHFGGIWLDVCEREPLPDHDPLFSVPGLYITPHITGNYHLDITVENILDITMHNYRAWHGEGTYRSVVNRTLGYAG